MISAWPDSLPRAQRQGHSYTQRDARVITNMQQGPPRMRRIFKNVPRTYRLQFRLSQTQLKTFEDFYENILDGGVKPTYIPVLDDSGYRSVSVLILKISDRRIAGGNYFNVSIEVVTH